MNADLARTIVDDIDTWVVDPDTPGVTWRLRVECDTDTSINDFESYGATMWTPDNSYGAFRPITIPESSKPHARVVEHGRTESLWWWPLPELWGTPEPWGTFAEDYAQAKRLMEDGFAVAILERRSQCVCCDSDLITSAALGGIDVWPDADPGYWVTIVEDRALEIGE